MSSMCVSHHAQWVSMDTVALFHLEGKMKSVVKRVFAVQGYSMYCVSHRACTICTA